MSHTKSETDIRKRKKQKKELIIGISLIGIALFGTFGFFRNSEDCITHTNSHGCC